jgi:hypothetical protein
MISCELQGGLSNQLFQIATTHALAEMNNDIAGFDLNTCHTPNQGNPSKNYTNSILSKINHVDNPYYRVAYNEPYFSYNEIPYVTDLKLQGYFQSYKYFKDIDVHGLFPFDLDTKNRIFNYLQNNFGVNPVTSVHIRRGDYLKNPDFHTNLPIEYYKEAMDIIGDSFFIFVSDDINWVKENFVGDNIFYSPFNSDVEDLFLMSQCDNNIIANSSFSWWGAYLNKNIGNKVVSPKNWFGKLGPKDTQDLIPDNWITI